MTRDQMEAHLSLLGWVPQTDTSYHRIMNPTLDQCIYTMRPDKYAAGGHVGVGRAALYGADTPFDSSWQAIPDAILARLFRQLQEMHDEFPT